MFGFILEGVRCHWIVFYILFLVGCEDIIAESISLDTLIAILKWSSQPYGSKWVHRQGLHFLCEEFTQVMTSDVFYELCKDHLQTAIQSDYLQVLLSCLSNCSLLYPDLGLVHHLPVA